MMTKEFERVRVEIDGKVARLVLFDPPVMNAVGLAMLDGLREALDFIESEGTAIRCVLLTGDGRAFCTGANLSDDRHKTPDKGGPAKRDAGAVLEANYHPILRRFRDLSMPLVTAVNGPAAGIGMSFALMGDMILAGRSAYFLQAFRRIGLVPDGGSTWLLPRLVGLARAKELSLLGEKLPAEKALEWGLINRVFDDADLMPEANKLAHELSEGPTVALGLIHRLYWQSPNNTYEAQLDLERSSQRDAGYTEDSREGVAAFVEKRKAEFKGE